MTSPKNTNGITLMALLAGVVIGGLAVGGVMMWRFEARMGKLARSLRTKKQSANALFPQEPIKPKRQRMVRRVRPLRLSPTQRRTLRRNWNTVQQNINQPAGGLIYRHALLREAVVRRILKQKKTLKVQFLHGIPRSEFYDALLFSPQEPSSQYKGFFGLSAQLWWSRDTGALRQRWLRYKRRFGSQKQPASQPTSRPTQGARLHFVHHKLHGLVAYWPRPNALLYMYCHKAFCQPHQLSQLTEHIEGQLKR